MSNTADLVAEIFTTASELPASERVAYLDGLRLETSVREEVEQLLQHHEGQNSRFLHPAVNAPPDSVPRLSVGDVLADRFRLTHLLAEGGMGVVYRAEQTNPVRRDVAIKVIKLGMDTERVIGRFRLEQQMLASLNHPHIAKVYEAGATEHGRPFFAMEYSDGEALTIFCDHHRLTVRERLDLFLDVCSAIQHAHQHGVIHRDIKPSNVLVESGSDRPIAKVIDFGIAKATDEWSTWFGAKTISGPLLGTPEYMSPEQATGNDAVDTRTDVYSLGVLLYELLTGSPALDPTALRHMPFDELCRRIREDAPVRPSTRLSRLSDAESGEVIQRRRSSRDQIVRELRGDLDWITMRAMEKDPVRRYQTVAGLADDIRRHLANEPVEAGPPTRSYRMRKFVARHRAAVVGSAVAIVAIIAALIATTTLAIGQTRALREAREARTAENEQRRIAEAVNEFLNRDVLALSNPLEGVKYDITMREVLDRAAVSVDSHFAGDPIVEATVRETLGDSYSALSEYEQARQQFERALSLRSPREGPVATDVLRLRRSVGTAHSNLAQYERAETLLNEALFDCRDEYGDDHVETIRVQTSLGWLYLQLARLSEAENVFARAVSFHDTRSDRDSSDALSARHGLARTLGNMSRHEEAIDLIEEIHEFRRNRLGDQHPSTINALSLIAANLQAMGQHSDAEAVYERVIEARHRVLGPEHAHTLVAEFELGVLYMLQTRWEDAERQLTLTAEKQARLLGRTHEDTLNTLTSLAGVYRHLKRHDEAEPLLVEILDERTASLGEFHPDTARALNELAALYWTMEDYERAEPLARRSLRLYEQTMGADHEFALIARNNLGIVMRNLRRFDEAIDLHRSAIDDGEVIFPEHHWYLSVFQGDLGITLLKAGRYEDAERQLLESFDGLTAALGEEHALIGKTITFLAELYTTWHEVDPTTGHADRAAEWSGRLPTSPEEG